MKVLVTGASGFIGSKVVELFAGKTDYEVLATGRSSTDRFSSFPNVNYFQQNLVDAIPTLRCDIVIHCAGLADDRSTMQDFLNNNVIATENLLKSVTGCRLFIFISSASVYDFFDGQPKTEEQIGAHQYLSDYGISKLKSEALLNSSGIPSIYILRPRAVYGPGDRVLLPRILQLIRKNRMIIPGKLSTGSSLTHVDNLCEAIFKSVQQSRPGVHTYNIADKERYNLQQVFSEIGLRKTGQKRLIQIPEAFVSCIVLVNQFLGIKGRLNKQSVQYMRQDSILAINKAREELGYEGNHGFFESINQLDI